MGNFCSNPYHDHLGGHERDNAAKLVVPPGKKSILHEEKRMELHYLFETLKTHNNGKKLKVSDWQVFFDSLDPTLLEGVTGQEVQGFMRRYPYFDSTTGMEQLLDLTDGHQTELSSWLFGEEERTDAMHASLQISMACLFPADDNEPKAKNALQLSGLLKEEVWTSGVFMQDLVLPYMNGWPHYSNSDGGHIFYYRTHTDKAIQNRWLLRGDMHELSSLAALHHPSNTSYLEETLNLAGGAVEALHEVFLQYVGDDQCTLGNVHARALARVGCTDREREKIRSGNTLRKAKLEKLPKALDSLLQSDGSSAPDANSPAERVQAHIVHELELENLRKEQREQERHEHILLLQFQLHHKFNEWLRSVEREVNSEVVDGIAQCNNVRTDISVKQSHALMQDAQWVRTLSQRQWARVDVSAPATTTNLGVHRTAQLDEDHDQLRNRRVSGAVTAIEHEFHLSSEFHDIDVPLDPSELQSLADRGYKLGYSEDAHVETFVIRPRDSNSASGLVGHFAALAQLPFAVAVETPQWRRWVYSLQLSHDFHCTAWIPADGNLPFGVNQWDHYDTVRTLTVLFSALGVFHNKSILYGVFGRAGRLTALCGGFRPGQRHAEWVSKKLMVTALDEDQQKLLEDKRAWTDRAAANAASKQASGHTIDTVIRVAPADAEAGQPAAVTASSLVRKVSSSSVFRRARPWGLLISCGGSKSQR
jgi:hypothetical protein